ncbi:MAG: hypothetical protein F7C35_01170 [Desulfurococcales archaeon]|nr:hypothetical protein [Desulfurococcales archaeon]
MIPDHIMLQKLRESVKVAGDKVDLSWLGVDYGLIVILLLAVVAGISLVLAGVALFEARRARMLLEAAISTARIRELSRIRRILSRKPRRRYIVFTIISEADLNEKRLQQEIIRLSRRIIGSAGLANSGIQLVYFNPITRRGVLRVRAQYKNVALGVLGLLREVDGEHVIVVPLITSGTIKRAKKIADGV